MNLKLILASWWTPRSVLIRELDRVAELTIRALDDLLAEHATSARSFSMQKRPSGKRLEDRRASMAEAHNKRVSALIDTLGAEEAVMVGREPMFKVGVQLGQEARRRLGVGTGMKDLVRAARIMYKVLGIEFKIEWNTLGGVTMRVSRCSLADSYSLEACMILSAADEGVVRGLNPCISMRFTERITSGSPVCVACIDRVIAEEERR
jgi:hypothetical protein